MRRIRLMPEAERTLTAQLDYLLERHATTAAQALKTRVERYLTGSVAQFPRTGKFIGEHGLWETWIPRTRLIVWYSFDDDEVAIITFWHGAQDRSSSDP